MYNPSLRQEPRYEPATVIPLKQESSLLDWLTKNDRIISREKQELETPNKNDEDISGLIDVDDDSYENDDDDDAEKLIE